MGRQALMTPRQRSFVGAALALLTGPVVLGSMACQPLPMDSSQRSRIDNQDECNLPLPRVDAGFDSFEGISKTRRAFDKAVREHIDCDELFAGEDLHLMRAERRDIEIAAGALEDRVDYDLG
jgi:hypothetical protein